MKIRTGFVSNSSSSSFVMLGFVLHELPEKNEGYDEDSGEWYTTLKSLLKPYGMTVFHDSEGSGNYYIGKMIDTWHDDDYRELTAVPITDELLTELRKGISNVLYMPYKQLQVIYGQTYS